jgi:hypothetical protein
MLATNAKTVEARLKSAQQIWQSMTDLRAATGQDDKDEELEQRYAKAVTKAAATICEASVLANLKLTGMSRQKVFVQFARNFDLTTRGLGDEKNDEKTVRKGALHPTILAAVS